MIDEKQVRRYCYEPEKIENYTHAVADKNETWDCHHRLETIMNCGIKELKAQECYYHRPAHDLIFLRHEDHISLHKKGNKNRLGRKHSFETKRKMSESRKGIKNMLGKHHSEETRRKMSEAMKGNQNCLGRKLSDETKKKMSEARKRYFEKLRAGK